MTDGGKADARFEYVYDVAYTPYKLSLPMEQYLNAALKKDLTVQLKELALDLRSLQKTMSANRIRVWILIRRKYNYDTAKRNLKRQKPIRKWQSAMRICSCSKWKTQITSAQSSLTNGTGRLPLRLQINLRAGNVTKTAVEQAEMGVVSAQNS